MLKEVTLSDGNKTQVHLAGWKRDKADKRDWVIKSPEAALKHAVTTLPSNIDNFTCCSPVEDQGALGSCSAHMFTGLVEYNDNKWGTKPGFTRTSRLFEYYATRKIEHTVGTDSGASIRDAIKAGVKYGIAPEDSWPYDISKFAKKPPSAIWTGALKHRIVAYHRINDGDLQTMKQVLASGYLIGFGFVVFDNMMTQEMASTGWLHRPGPNDAQLGGHACCLVGYSDTQKAFKVRNSWGTSWGIPTAPGYFWMDYDYVADTTLANDFWVVDSTVEL